MMEINVSNFLVDHWLDDTYLIEKVYINAIPARLEAIITNQLDMGLFPKAITSVSEMKDLEKLSFDPVDGYSPDLMVFTNQAIKWENSTSWLNTTKGCIIKTLSTPCPSKYIQRITH